MNYRQYTFAQSEVKRKQTSETVLSKTDMFVEI